MADLHLNAGEVKFLASRLRRLFDNFGYQLPDLAEEDANLIRIAGTCIGDLLRQRDAAGVMGMLCDKADLHRQPCCAKQCEKCADSQGNSGVTATTAPHVSCPSCGRFWPTHLPGCARGVDSSRGGQPS